MSTILVTGGCGYIGAHTVVDLVENGFNVISIDSNERSHASIMDGVSTIVGKKITNYVVNLCNLPDTEAVFTKNPNIVGIIHFAAYKAVGESVQQPLLYYKNNIEGLNNILHLAQKYNVPHFVFSSSCTVYGNPTVQQVTEDTPVQTATSPYGATKQMGERIITDVSSQNLNSILLRYFNPVGAHPSLHIGELPIGKPANLVPAITQTAIGKLPQMQVFGTNYPTKDGSCLRDYIHVCDIAHAHTLALQYLISKKNIQNTEVFNLGSGQGYTVLEVIKAFETVNNITLNYTTAPRRQGDVEAIYANNQKAKTILGWQTKFTLTDMVRTAWQWEKKIATKQGI
jgi:UDP-glucose 4-epimerase